MICNNSFPNSFKDFLTFWLVYSFVQKPVFEGYKFDISDFINAIFHESANRLTISDYA